MAEWTRGSRDRSNFRATKDGPEVTGQPKKKKNTKRWCRGKEGREHVPVVRKNKFFAGITECKTLAWVDENHWMCIHEVGCSACGKTLKHRADKCPDKPQ